jgi:hypothetical protein
MSPSVRWSIVAGVVLFVLFAAALLFSMTRQFAVTCEVCITFEGRSACREAYGKTEEEAIRTATDNACGLLASGMTQSIACGNVAPDSTSCQP